jgi:ribulose bisphosphate carboxylase small subunit
MTDEIQRLIRKTVHSGYAIERTAELVSVERTHSIAQITLEAERKAEQQAIANLKAFEKAHADELKEVGR